MKETEKITDKTLSVGIDIGSTTTKVIAYSDSMEPVFKEYRRHFGNITESLMGVLKNLNNQAGNTDINFLLTGSAGMGLSENFGLPFVQELIAASEFITVFYPEVKTLIDIGGEDSKIIFLKSGGNHDIRMNGNCAGGTGSFLDQMASIMNVELSEFDKISSLSTHIYPIASRCGVFAKTDVQNLLSRKIPLPDIAKSVYHALALQLSNTLLKGSAIEPVTVFSGGPLTFLPSLRETLKQLLKIEATDFIDIKNQEFITAAGAAIVKNYPRLNCRISELINQLKKRNTIKNISTKEPLFKNYYEYSKWKLEKDAYKAERCELKTDPAEKYFLGIDSGSTTTKIVVIDSKGRLLFDFYRNNNSDPIGAVKEGLEKLRLFAKSRNTDLHITHSAVTGYGEDLIFSAFSINYGIVETIAHFRAAQVFDEKVSFILDIGGQDMKAIFAKDGIIRNIVINEACSSGCGSFIENFAKSLNYTVEKFSELACSASAPSDLGTRCTVFMNSKVKQAFREGNEIRDISAGLALSVVNNCLHKVLKIHDKSLLGDSIIVQGGTFRNTSIHKAFENIIGKKVICPDISELMGAYGSALTALDKYNSDKTGFYIEQSIEEISNVGDYTIKQQNCKGCENLCKISSLTFSNGNRFFTGNKCEKVFTNRGVKIKKGVNFSRYKYELIFNRNQPKNNHRKNIRIGIPRVLNMFGNYPFWHTLFSECGFELVLSDKTTQELYEKGSGYLMSDNICFPAKVVHGHILNLVNKRVDRIFYPIITYEFNENPDSANCFNCPVVTGYPDLIRNTQLSDIPSNILLDTPNINFKEISLLKKACFSYLMALGCEKKELNLAFDKALEEQNLTIKKLKLEASKIIRQSREQGNKLFVLAGRPYHLDPLINQNIPEIITDFGITVLTEDSLPYSEKNLENIDVITQWAYPNRIYKAAKWVSHQENTEFIMINSFGCGPDSIVADEVKEILESKGKNFTMIRVDELNSSVSLRLRIRSLIESVKIRDNSKSQSLTPITRRTTKPFTIKDKSRKILAPHFSPFHLAYIAGSFKSLGYNLEILPPSDKHSIDIGLKYVNNEICYPATIIIGDIIKALQSGEYDIQKVAVGLTQTGGQCRASNYIPLLKKSLVKAGFDKVPVVAITLAKGNLNYQPGFKVDKSSLVIQGIKGLLFGDSLSGLYYSTAPRELIKGASISLVNKYNKIILNNPDKINTDFLIDLLEEAVEDFNNIKVVKEYIPKIGIVGEVFVKNNSFGNNYIVESLVQSGYEIVMPPLINMFIQWFVNVEIKNTHFIEKNLLIRNLARLMEQYYNRLHRRFEKVNRKFKYYTNHPSIREIAAYAENKLNMATHYFGEGWMIAGDMGWMYENGIKDVVCLQPFGCLANHIVAKGLEKKLKELYPDLNIAFLDIDYGSSDVNLQNRLYLLLDKVNRKKNYEILA